MAVYWLMTLCSILMMTFAASGLVVYVMVMLILMARKKFSRKSYFLLACWLGVADCICLLLMLSYSAPSIFLGHRLHQSHIFGAVLNIGWFSGLAIILLIAGDRYLCMCHQTLHKTCYNIRNVKWYCLLAWIFGTSYSIPSFLPQCSIHFYVELLSWRWNVKHDCAGWLSKAELVMVITITAIAFTLNGLVLR